MAFLDATRQNIRPLDGSLNYSSGGRSTARFPRTGLLSRIWLHVHGTLTVTPGGGSATKSPYGPFNLIESLSFKANQGMDIIRMGGFDAWVLDVTRRGKSAYVDGLNSNTDGLHNFDVGSGGKPFEFWLKLDVTSNERDLIGLILLQTDQMSAELEINWAPVGGSTNASPVVLSGGATASLDATCDVLLETFTLPADPADRPDLSVVYQQLKRTDAIDHIGENRIDMLRANLYSSILHVIDINGQPADRDDINTFRLRYNNDNTPYQIPVDAQLRLQRERYGFDLPTGVYLHDLAYQGIPGFGMQRDLINAASVAEFASLIDIASGATLGSGNNRISTITQQFVMLGGVQR